MLRKWIKWLLPPIIMKLVRYDYRYGWHGRYADWQAAMKDSSGYDSPAILEKIKSGVTALKEGKAVFERDGLLFDTIPCSLPVLAALRWSASLTNNRLFVTDIGGSLGTGYRQHSHFLKDIHDIRWSIVEQKHFADCGKQYFQEPSLLFFSSIEESLADSHPGMALFSTSLQYFESPYRILREVAAKNFDFILIDRIGLSPDGADRLTLQVVPPHYYNAKYPCWFLSSDKIKDCLSEQYDFIEQYQTAERHTLGFHEFSYDGLLFKRKIK